MRKCKITGKLKVRVNKGEFKVIPYEKEGKMDKKLFYPDPYKAAKFYNTTDCTGTFAQSQLDMVLITDVKFKRKQRK